ncbi:MAG: hypothetical protein GY936_03420 [Ignavibacteriae bacterium]|nr:hypothetical protein [Ignavibacteriota bacterium]
MNLIIPNNIFTALFALCAKGKQELNLIIKESSLITRELLAVENSVALIPSLDLIQHKDLYISKNYAITFTDELSNAYLYFSSESEALNSLHLKGDVSSNEVILSKIILKEKFDLSPDISLYTSENLLSDSTYLISGSNNWIDNKFEKAASFSEYISESLDAPYINFVLAAKDEQVLKDFTATLDKLNPILENRIDSFLENLDYSDIATHFIKEAIATISFDITEDDNFALNELLQLVYFHKVYDEMIDVKFV